MGPTLHCSTARCIFISPLGVQYAMKNCVLCLMSFTGFLIHIFYCQLHYESYLPVKRFRWFLTPVRNKSAFISSPAPNWSNRLINLIFKCNLWVWLLFSNSETIAMLTLVYWSFLKSAQVYARGELHDFICYKRLFIYLVISYLIYAVCCFQYSFQSLDLVVQILVLTLQMTILSRIQRRRNLARWKRIYFLQLIK